MKLSVHLAANFLAGRRVATSQPRRRSGLPSPRDAVASTGRLRNGFHRLFKGRAPTAPAGERVLPRPRNPFSWPRLRKVAPEPEPAAGRADTASAPVPTVRSHRDYVRDAVAAALGRESLADALAPEVQTLIEDLAALDDAFAATGHAGYSLDGLLTVLCDHARIREYAKGSELERAVQGLGALAGVLRDSLGEQRDGCELNALLGLDSALDGAIAALRTQRVEAFMLKHAEHANPADLRGTAKQQAQELVQAEVELAYARLRLQRALERSGAARTLGGLAGLRVDAKLVIKVREQLGPKGTQVGIALAGLLIAQRDVSDSPAAARMRADVDHALQHVAGERSATRWLEQRRDGLATEIDPNKGVIQPGQSSDQACIALCGLTKGELQMLGLSTLDLPATRSAIRHLARQGLSSVREAGAALSTMAKVGKVMASRNAPERLTATSLMVLQGAKNEEKARRLGDRLLQGLSGNTSLRLDHLQDAKTSKEAADQIVALGRLAAPAQATEELQATAENHSKQQLLLTEQSSLLPWAQQNARDEAMVIGHITRTTGVIDSILAQRRKLLGDEYLTHLRTGVRAAILLQLRGVGMHQFKPAGHAEAVRKTLAQWGVDVQALAPEIDQQLEREFSLDAVAQWVEQEGVPTSETASTDARQALMDSIDAVQPSTRLKVNWGGRIEAQTGTIPLDVSMTAGVNIKAAAGQSSGIEIARVPDGGKERLELQVRHGKDFKLGAEAYLRLWYLQQLGLRADAMVDAQIGRQASEGFVLHFTADAKGRAALKKLLAQLLDHEPLTPADLAQVEGILPLHENKTAFKTGMGARLGVDPGDSDAGWSGSDRFTIRATVKAMAHVGGHRTRFTSENNNLSVERSDIEGSVEAGAIASLGLRVGFTESADADQSHSATASVLEAGVSATAVIRRKKKVVRGADGLVQVGTERWLQKSTSARTAPKDAMDLGGRAFIRQMALMRERDPDAAAAVDALTANAGTNDLLSIGWTLRPKAAQQINAHLSHARALRRGRAGTGTAAQAERQAAAEERQAQALLGDMRAYRIARISLIPTAERCETLTQLNLLLIQKTSYVEEKGEYVAWEVKPDLAIAEEVCDELYGWPLA